MLPCGEILPIRAYTRSLAASVWPRIFYHVISFRSPPLNRPSKYKPQGGLYLEIALKYKVKQSKNGKFPSNYKASPIDFEMQISLRT